MLPIEVWSEIIDQVSSRTFYQLSLTCKITASECRRKKTSMVERSLCFDFNFDYASLTGIVSFFQEYTHLPNGEKHGIENLLYSNGQMDYDSNYPIIYQEIEILWQFGKKHGNEKYIAPDRKCVKIVPWDQGVRHGEEIRYIPYCKHIVPWNRGVRHGEEQYVMYNGYIYLKTHWVDGQVLSEK